MNMFTRNQLRVLGKKTDPQPLRLTWGEEIKKMMKERHQEASHVATDRQFINPFGIVRRRRRERRERRERQAFE